MSDEATVVICASVSALEGAALSTCFISMVYRRHWRFSSLIGDDQGLRALGGLSGAMGWRLLIAILLQKLYNADSFLKFQDNFPTLKRIS